MRTDGLDIMEIDRVTPHEPGSLFSPAFWQACEREAAQLLRGLTGADDE
ncbi:hypothetical protein IEZ26_03615 [Nocardioides cavernae]|uniref:Uncharacterized protein n=1 Tax=Nocardioides cavernae TaxID=1921566 RepID=A0ABR8N6A7_9ACTN|nr:hypothetical protein [Nocardioides cavernae]MBD3923696.1 hypothetical protein [Nocardioides cavernae]MBM7511371.1 hypothetical protein [Nocardioides cavernae]